MTTIALKRMMQAELAFTTTWNSLNSAERLAYQVAVCNLESETADASGKSWWDSLSNPQRTAYIKNHPATKFAGHLKTLPTHIQERFKNLTHNSKKAISDWHEKTPTEKAATAGKTLVHATKHFGHHIVHHIKHEKDTYLGAGAAIKHLATGKSWKSMDVKHKKGLRNALIHAGITAGSMALGDATGGSGINAVGHLLASFGAEHAHHAALLGAGEIGLKTAKDAIKKATAKPNKETAAKDKSIEVEAAKIVKMLCNADIPSREWINIMHAVEQKRKQMKTGAK